MRVFEIPFREVVIRLDRPESKAAILAHSPSGLVPCLRDGEAVIWDSLAIGEYLAELYPERNLWPESLQARTMARSMSAEMHTGYSVLRRTWPMEFAREGARVYGGPDVRKDIDRLVSIWGDALDLYGNKTDGPFLFGKFCIADAMFAPVVSRLRTYGPVRVPTKITKWLDAVWSLPALQTWGEGAREEVEAGWYT